MYAKVKQINISIMFNLFKKKSRIEVLQKEYERLMKESYKLSTINRKASDQKMAEANRLLEEMDAEKVA